MKRSERLYDLLLGFFTLLLLGRIFFKGDIHRILNLDTWISMGILLFKHSLKFFNDHPILGSALINFIMTNLAFALIYMVVEVVTKAPIFLLSSKNSYISEKIGVPLAKFLERYGNLIPMVLFILADIGIFEKFLIPSVMSLYRLLMDQ